jgi:magnesium-transporting ATPase (P-type)
MQNICSNRRYKLTIVKRFEFSSKYQSMSVIVHNNLDKKYRFFIKGAPERIMQHCNPESLPEGFNEKLLEHTKSGYRVLAAATKPLDGSLESYGRLAKDEDRFKFENKLTFLGLIVFKNKLKKDTKHIIQKLNQSNCRMIMATGDNPFTSISVSRECELLKEEDKIFLFDLERGDGKQERLKLQFINQGNDVDESDDMIQKKNPNELLSNRSDLRLLNSRNARQKKISLQENVVRDENNIQPLLERIKDDPNAILCISGKCFEYIINKFIEEQEVGLLDKHKEEKVALKDTITKRSTMSASDFRKSLQKLSLFSNDSYKQILNIIFSKGKIFFRMSPNNKVLLVDFLKKDENSIVAMCGDGANDCGALLAADIGISLCNKIGNNVTSHFYSKDGSISCIEVILRNGRACYENSTIIFKYMIIYSIILVSTVIILFYVQNDLDTNHFLFIDFFISMISCLLSSKTGPGYTVEKSKVPLTIVNFKFVITILGHIVIEVLLQAILIYIVFVGNFKDYDSISVNESSVAKNNVTSFLFVFTCFQYIYMLFIFNSTSKHRKNFYANKMYIFYTSAMIFYISSLVSSEGLNIDSFSFGLVDFDIKDYRYTDINEIKKLICLTFIVINIIVTTIYEVLISMLVK